MKVLVVGYGSIGKRHAANALALGHNVEVFDAAQVVGFTKLEDALAWRPDAVVIATPAETHARLFSVANDLAPFVPILVEKPLAVSIDDWRANASCGSPHFLFVGRIYPQSDRDVPFLVGCNWRFHPFVCELRHRSKDVVDAPLKSLFVCCSRISEWPGSSYGDALLEIGAHEIDLALALLGPARLTEAVREPLRDGWRLNLLHKSGCQTQVVIFGDAEPFRTCRIAWLEYEGGYDVDYSNPLTQAALDASYQAELAYFLDIARGRTPEPPIVPAATLADGLAVLRIIGEARRIATEIAP